MPCQIVVLRVQSKLCASKAALQRLHGCGHDFFIFFRAFPDGARALSAFCDRLSFSASAKCGGGQGAGPGKPVESHWRMFPFRASPRGRQEYGDKMRVIGIDPGLRNLGWGVIEVAGSRLTHVANGICRSDGAEGDLAARLLSLHGQLTAVLRAWVPQAAAVEHTFVNKDAVATLKLGQARGIALLVPAQFGLSVGEYAPNAVKKTVVGVGHAAKVQVDHMVRLHLPGVQVAGADAADALAVAICHAHHLQSAGRLAAAVRAAG
jgi:crossover junction endodeoxyribonuclease RuvC